MSDVAGQAAGGELVAGLLRVIACVEVDGDVVRERAEVVEFVQRGGQQRGVVPVRRGEHPAERNALLPDHERAFHAQLAAAGRARAGAVPAAGGFGDAPVGLLAADLPLTALGPGAGSEGEPDFRDLRRRWHLEHDAPEPRAAHGDILGDRK